MIDTVLLTLNESFKRLISHSFIKRIEIFILYRLKKSILRIVLFYQHDH